MENTDYSKYHEIYTYCNIEGIDRDYFVYQIRKKNENSFIKSILSLLTIFVR